jgi:hypothetical protein
MTRSGVAFGGAGLAVAITLALILSDAGGPNSQRSNVRAEAATGSPASIGDGVCTDHINAVKNSTALAKPPGPGVKPVHTKAEALEADRDATSRFRDLGVHDAYFALVDVFDASLGDPSKAGLTGDRPMWVVEINNLNTPWGVGGPRHSGPPVTVMMHHIVSFYDDATLRLIVGVMCP